MNLILTSAFASGFAFVLYLYGRCLQERSLSRITRVLLHLAQDTRGALSEMQENFAAVKILQALICFISRTDEVSYIEFSYMD